MTRKYHRSVSGILIKGHRVASGLSADSPYPGGSIALQTPFFKKLGLDLSPFYQGTLNIDIQPESFEMREPDYVFKAVNWIDIIPPEDFFFKHCRLSGHFFKMDGLIYYPSPKTKVQHFQAASLIEILAPYIPNLKYGSSVTLQY